MTLEEFSDAYLAKAHAIQTGVAYLLNDDPTSGTPKHLRTGLNYVMSDLGSLTKLLVNKGVIAEAEVQQAILAGLDREIALYESELQKHYGTGETKITLG